MEHAKDPMLKRRIALALVGMLLAGVSVGIFKRAFFGVDPFQCFCGGLANVIPISFGTLYMLINAALLIVDPIQAYMPSGEEPVGSPSTKGLSSLCPFILAAI